MTSVPPEQPARTFIPVFLIDIGELCVAHLKFLVFVGRTFCRDIFRPRWNTWNRFLATCGGEIIAYYIRANYRPSSMIMYTLFSATSMTWTFFSCFQYASVLCDFLTLHRFFFCCCNGQL